MDEKDLEKLGLNKNEAKVYLALLYKGQATAAELVKAVGVHRNIIYDNLEKLTEKGLVSSISEKKKIFIAQKPVAIIEFLESKKSYIDAEIDIAKNLIPDINKVLGSHNSKQDAALFRGIGGLKKVLGEILESKEMWIIGITNESIRVLGTTYWKSFNQKATDRKIKEHILLNHSYKDPNTGIYKIKNVETRTLPEQLDQVTETIMWNDKVAIFVYSSQPIVIVMENKDIFKMYKAHFDFLWKLSK